MRNALLPIVVLAIAVGSLSGCSGIDPWRLQGTWEASVTYGNTTTVTHRLIVDGDELEFKALGLIPSGKIGTFKLNAFSDPKEIDFQVETDYVGEGSFQIVENHDPAETSYGIYKISDGVLTIQFGDDGDRPTSFDSDEAISLARVED